MSSPTALERVVLRAAERLVERGATFALVRLGPVECVAGSPEPDRTTLEEAGVFVEWCGPLQKADLEREVDTIRAVVDGQRRLEFQRSLLERLAEITSMPPGLDATEAIQAIADRARTGLGVHRVTLEVRTTEAIHKAESGRGTNEAERLVTLPTRTAHSTITIPAILDDDLVDVLQVVASHLATAVDNALAHEQSLHQARIEEEYEIASRVQQAVLTRRPIPQLIGLDIDAVSRPARVVGGDFYEFLAPSEQRSLVVLGDVSGKGLPAAILTSLALSTISTKAEFLPEPTPALVLARAAEDLYQPFTDVGMFTTAVVVEIDCRRMVLADAGHGLVIRRRWGLGPDLIRATDPPIGVLRETSGTVTSFDLDPGDLVIIVSDGITDQRDPRGSHFGLDRLLALVAGGEGPLATDWVNRVLAAVDAHASGREPDDDQTVMAVVATDHDVTRLDLDADLEALRLIPAWLTERLPDTELRTRVELAVHELCVNAVTHGQASGLLTVGFWQRPGHVGVEISYDGPPFDPSNPSEIPLEPTVHGYGLGLVHSLADEVVHRRRRLNHTRLRFERLQP